MDTPTIKNKKTRIAIDIDGVITANPPALSWFTYHLMKNENDIEVYVISWRNGADVNRMNETERDLNRFGISYTSLILAPRKFKTLHESAIWKISIIKAYNITMWFDDELKNFSRDLGIDVKALLPDVIQIHI